MLIGWTEQLSSFNKNKAKSCLFTARLEVKANIYHFLNQTQEIHRKTKTDFSPRTPKINYNNSNNDYTVRQKEQCRMTTAPPG